MGWDRGEGRGERWLHNYGEEVDKEGGRRDLHAISLMGTLSMIHCGLRKQRDEVLLPLCHAFPLPQMTFALSTETSQHPSMFSAGSNSHIM